VLTRSRYEFERIACVSIMGAAVARGHRPSDDDRLRGFDSGNATKRSHDALVRQATHGSAIYLSCEEAESKR